MQLVLLDKVSVLKNGFIKSYDVNDKKVLIVQNEDKIYAIENKCGHQCVPLHDGDVIDNNIRCKVHGIKFSLEDGSQQNRFDDETDSIEVFSIGYSDDNEQFGVYI